MTAMFSERLGVKLTAAAGATALVTIGVFALFNIRSHRDSLEAEVARHADQLSEAVKAGTEFDMLLNQRERLQGSIVRMGRAPGIGRVRVLNKAGRVIYSSEPAEVGTTVDRASEACARCHSGGPPVPTLDASQRVRVFRAAGGGRTLGIINPIYNQPSCWTASCHAHAQGVGVLGVLDVTLPLAEVDQSIRRARLEVAVFAAGATLALSLLIGLLARRWVAAPTQALLAGTRRVAGGDLSTSLEARGSDELAQLTRSFNDMTRKLAEARLQLFQSDKMASLGRLAAGVAHEINNPLTGVLTYASFLLKRSEGDAERADDLKVIVRETLRCREIVKSLLDFARQSVPRKVPVDVNEVLERAVAVTANPLVLAKARLVCEPGSGLPRAVVDANQLQQVFINLLVNAADSLGPDGGSVTVRTALRRLPAKGSAHVRAAVCPKRHSLLDREALVDGRPSVKLAARWRGGAGTVHLDPGFGSAAPLRGLGGTEELSLACPDCAADLLVKGKSCPRCGGPVYTFEAPPKGMLEGCPAPGCRWQSWEALEGEGEREFIEASVADTGSGISPENLPRLFEPFFSTKGQKGNGLGLAVIWGIVDNHGGTIRVDSAVGRGSTFTVLLPVRP
ncbi:HAMP domain-containing protein [bacterium]|nr:MAG: HAMP domain-containing protein [bacterium]